MASFGAPQHVTILRFAVGDAGTGAAAPVEADGMIVHGIGRYLHFIEQGRSRKGTPLVRIREKLVSFFTNQVRNPGKEIRKNQKLICKGRKLTRLRLKHM
jgi:hypothetical protein